MPELNFKDPLAGRESLVTLDEPPVSLLRLKQMACAELAIAIPQENSGEFLERVTVTVAGKKLAADEDVLCMPNPATLVCFVRPRLVQSSACEVEDEDEDEVAKLDREVDELFRIRQSRVPPRVRKFVLETMRLPEWVVGPLTHIRMKQVVVFAAWIAGSKLCSMYELGGPYLLATLFFLIFTNLSTAERREGEWSAYSVFNRGVRRLGGDNLDGNVRTGGWFGL
jgi:hypothetical protein